MHDAHIAMTCTCIHNALMHMFCTNSDMQDKHCIMMDDAFVHHANTLFDLSCACVGLKYMVSVPYHNVESSFSDGDVDFDPRSNLVESFSSGGR